MDIKESQNLEKAFLSAVADRNIKAVKSLLNAYADNYENHSSSIHVCMTANDSGSASNRKNEMTEDVLATTSSFRKKPNENTDPSDDSQTHSPTKTQEIESSCKCLSYRVWSEALLIVDSKCYPDIKSLLFEYYPVVLKPSINEGPLLHQAVIDWLNKLQEGEHNAETKYQDAYLAEMKKKKMRIIEILLEYEKIEAHAKNSQKETILHLICRHPFSKNWSNNLKQLFGIIMKSKIDVNCKNRAGKTALMMACEYGRFEIVTAILQWMYANRRYLDVNAADNSGKTALMFACENGFAPIVEQLLQWRRLIESNYDLDAVDINGETVRMKAKQRKYFEIISMFLENDFLGAVEKGDKETVQTFLNEYYLDYRRCLKPLEILKHQFGDSQTVVVADVLPRDSSISMNTWEIALRKAADKGHQDIFLLLLDTDFPDWCDRLSKLYFPSKFLDVLLKSGKLSGIYINGMTLLHFLCDECRNSFHGSWSCRRNHRKKEIHEITETLLNHSVNINARNSRNGHTALMMASGSGCISTVYTILKWAKETGNFLDLDARDMEDHTALMHAVRNKHPDVLQMLLEAGASVNLTDITGYTVLHLALHQHNPLTMILYGEDPRDFSELNARLNAFKLSSTVEEPDERYCRNREQLIKDVHETVILLLQNTTIDVNALDDGGFSPLDMALRFRGDLTRTIELLEQKGAKLNALQSNTQQTEGPNFSIRGRNMLHRIAIRSAFIANDVDLFVLKNFIRKTVEESSKEIRDNLVSAKDFRGRTALHLAAIYCTPQRNVVDTLISLGCNVNETDNYGHTALHYARNREIADFLLKNGADPRMSDENGISAIEMYEKRLSQTESDHSILNKNFIEEILAKSVTVKGFNGPMQSLHFHGKRYPGSIIDEKLRLGLYTQDELEYRKSLSSKINDEIKEVMENLAAEIKRRDPRFEVQLIHVGSSYEGTRICKPDEFDFNLILTKFSQQCEVTLSPEFPPGFVQLRRKQNYLNESEFDNFFYKTGILNTERVNAQFVQILQSIMEDFKFVEGQKRFDWEWGKYLVEPNEFNKNNIQIPTLKFRRANPVVDSNMFLEDISVDFVPCIHIDDWWPDEALTNARETIKARGCYLIFDWPHRKYPWIPFSEPGTRITFAPMESEIIRNSSTTAKSAYMIVKEMLKEIGKLTKAATSYVLKTCFLYCIEAFTPTPEQSSQLGLSFSELKAYFNQLSIEFWLENLTKHLMKFVFQDFCPSYFIPTYHMPIGRFLKEYHTKLSAHCNVDDIIELYSRVYQFYRCVSQKDCDLCVGIPTLNPIWETFDRDKLITELLDAAYKELGINSKECSDCTDSNVTHCNCELTSTCETRGN